jgi:hypothetical protein
MEAADGGVEVGEFDAIFRKCIQVGRLDFTAEAADVGPTHIIDHYQKNIGFARRGYKRRQKQRKHQNGAT